MSGSIVAKKCFGQNFLINPLTVEKILSSIYKTYNNEEAIIEIGPGTGVLTEGLAARFSEILHLVEIDTDLVAPLKENFKNFNLNILNEDVLKLDLRKIGSGKKIMVVGNIPYNISSPIFFKFLKHKDTVSSMIFMVQHEVAARIASKPNSKEYGIPSVLLQAFYDVEYLFSVPNTDFDPAPKVTSAVIKLMRNSVEKLPCNESDFFTIVKQAFNQRRKTIKNSLKGLLDSNISEEILQRRAEQLSVDDFIMLTNSKL